MPSLVAPLRPRRPRSYLEAASVAVWFWLCVGSLLWARARELKDAKITRYLHFAQFVVNYAKSELTRFYFSENMRYQVPQP